MAACRSRDATSRNCFDGKDSSRIGHTSVPYLKFQGEPIGISSRTSRDYLDTRLGDRYRSLAWEPNGSGVTDSDSHQFAQRSSGRIQCVLANRDKEPLPREAHRATALLGLAHCQARTQGARCGLTGCSSRTRRSRKPLRGVCCTLDSANVKSPHAGRLLLLHPSSRTPPR